MASDTDHETLKEAIRDALLVDEPGEDALVDALDGAVSITKQHWRIIPRDPIHEREPKDQVFSYLLAKYAAARVSDRHVPMRATREELCELWDRKLVKEVADHGWVRNWDGNVQIRPRFYEHTAKELAARYGPEGYK